jgi:hypothetical protein
MPTQARPAFGGAAVASESVERLGSFDGLDPTASGPISQRSVAEKKLASRVKIELLRGEILDAIGGMQASLDAARAMAEIPSDSGLLHGLRIAQAHGRVIWASAADLRAVHAELASVLRQPEDA